jgi:hypothetical protein
VTKIPHFLNNRLTDGKVLSVTRAGRALPQERFLVLIYVSGWVNPMAIVELEGLRKMKTIDDQIGN